ncbi:hypothetical protein V8F33_009208 [Rhypophila sp. PSN 637]
MSLLKLVAQVMLLSIYGSASGMALSRLEDKALQPELIPRENFTSLSEKKEDITQVGAGFESGCVPRGGSKQTRNPFSPSPAIDTSDTVSCIQDVTRQKIAVNTSSAAHTMAVSFMTDRLEQTSTQIKRSILRWTPSSDHIREHYILVPVLQYQESSR